MTPSKRKWSSGALVMLMLTACAPSDSAPQSAAPPSKPAAAEADPKVAALRSAVEREPGNSQAVRRLAIALIERGDVDEGLTWFETDVELNPSPSSLLNLGQAYGRASRLGDAESAYQRVLKLVPNHPNALHGLGNVALRRGEAEAAIDWYSRAVAAKSDYMLAQTHLGDALKSVGRLDEAYRAYAVVLEREPKSAQELEAYDSAAYNLAAVELARGGADRAAEILEELLSINPRHHSANYAYGQALLQLGRPEEAKQAFQRHMKITDAIRPSGPTAMGD